MGEVLAEVEPLIQKARLATSAEVAAELPSIFSDRQKVKQVVLNLLTNAIKFTPRGAVKVMMLEGRITVESRPGQGSTFTLRVPRRGRRK